MSAFDHGCTYVDPRTGAPCLKGRGHDDFKGGWRCPYCGPGPGLPEYFVCKCGMGAQAPSQHLTFVGPSGPVLKIVPLESLEVVPHYSSSMLDGVLLRGVRHAEDCAARQAPAGALLVGLYRCDCGASG